MNIGWTLQEVRFILHMDIGWTVQKVRFILHMDIGWTVLYRRLDSSCT